jgi:catechol 2,3-dioxygenase-like lactoylglutathione lyase family enzyme
LNILRLDSVVFETPDLARVRRFYVDVLGLRVGTFVRDGKTVADEDESYFNLNVGGTLLGFEKGRAQQGTVVLIVEDLSSALAGLKTHGVEPARWTADFAIIHDPDEREIILQTES